MPKFSYHAINETGSTVSGEVEADSLKIATNILNQRGYIPTKVTKGGDEAGGSLFSGIEEKFSKIKTRDLILFTKQFRTMIRAGVPVLTILKVLEAQTENPKMKKTVDAMGADIKEGVSLYDAFKKHPRVFSPLYCSMVKAGETSGALPEVLDRLIYIIEHENKIKSDIKSALQYPIIVVIFLGLAFFILLTFVIPRFAKIFMNAGLDLPLPTRICISLNQFFADYWFLVLAGVIGVITVIVLYLKTDQGKYVRDSFFLRLPIMGPLFLKAAMSRFASIFAILQSSGIHVLESMEILSNTMGNSAIAREFDRIKEQLEAGRGISGPLRSAKHFPPMVINMVAIGEESGSLDDMLREVSAHYDDEVEYSMHRLSEAIGPILTIGLAAVVGFFALAIFLPMWDLTKAVTAASH